MASRVPKTTITTVRDSKSGRFVTVKGAGALKGKMMISKRVDLTKPISGPTPRGEWTPKRDSFSDTTTSKGSIADISAGKR